MLKDAMHLPIILNESLSGQVAMPGVYVLTQMCNTLDMKCRVSVCFYMYKMSHDKATHFPKHMHRSSKWQEVLSDCLDQIEGQKF